MPGGMLLIGANPRAVELTFDQLRRELQQLLAKTFAAPTTTLVSSA
jgi:hypothetical protein